MPFTRLEAIHDSRLLAWKLARARSRGRCVLLPAETAAESAIAAILLGPCRWKYVDLTLALWDVAVALAVLPL